MSKTSNGLVKLFMYKSDFPSNKSFCTTNQKMKVKGNINDKLIFHVYQDGKYFMKLFIHEGKISSG